MPELVASKSLPRPQFIVSLPLSLMSAMSLICAAPYFEGVDVWLSETRQKLDPAFLQQMALILGFPGRFQRFTEEVQATLLAEDPRLSHTAFMDRLRALPQESYVDMAHRAIAKGGKPPLSLGEVQTLLQNSTALSEHLLSVDLKVELQPTLAFLKDLMSLKSRFIATLERFWQEVYEQEWMTTLPVMERSATYHRRQRYRLNFPDLFMAVTGRLLPRPYADLFPERIRFVPSCYIGPYYAFMRHTEELTIFYNCRATPSGRHPGQGPGLFPLLKALADETRLQIVEMLRGREMYAQQIVERLGISQAAVSRHLRLMASAGVLRVRREGGSKFYTIESSTLTYLADALQELGE